MTFLNVSLAYLGKMEQPQSASLSFVLKQNMNLRINSQYQYISLLQNVFQFVHNVRCSYLGDEYRSTVRNVSTNLQNYRRHSLRNSYYWYIKKKKDFVIKMTVKNLIIFK